MRTEYIRARTVNLLKYADVDRTRIGLESDAASKCDGNRGCDVSYGTALFLSRVCGHLYTKCEKRERDES